MLFKHYSIYKYKFRFIDKLIWSLHEWLFNYYTIVTYTLKRMRLGNILSSLAIFVTGIIFANQTLSSNYDILEEDLFIFEQLKINCQLED